MTNATTPISPNDHDSLHTNNQHNYKSQNSVSPQCYDNKLSKYFCQESGLYNVVDQYKPELITGTESWLSSSIPNYEIFPQDYNIFCKDRADGYGGVFIASRNHVVSYELPLDTSCEFTVCKLITTDKPLIFCSAYRPPNNNSIYLEELCQDLNNNISDNPDHVIWIAGDINFPNID